MRSPAEDCKPLRHSQKQWIVGKRSTPRRAARDQCPCMFLSASRSPDLTSEDVIHSFYVPAFRVKQDVLPGRLHTQLWFTATQLGIFRFSAPSTAVWTMRGGGKYRRHGPATISRWLEGHAGAQSLQPAERHCFPQPRLQRLSWCECVGTRGRIWTVCTDIGCSSRRQTPSSLRSLYPGSITLPTAALGRGFAPLMPSFAGKLSEEESACAHCLPEVHLEHFE